VDTPETLRDGRYVVVGVLGSGAQGETLDAVDKKDGRPVAIKRFFVRGAKSWKDVELAEREARVLAGISYPGFPAYLDHFEERGALCLVMEKVEGESLAALRKRGGRLSQADVVRLLNEAADGLDYLHTRAPPIIHRDLKPGNVIRRPDGSFAFVDFGSVRDTLKPEGGSTVVGTFGYMAPEQFQGRAGAGSDVYAVGATALSLLTGTEPEDLPHRGLGIDVSGALGSGMDPRLVRALSAMLEPDPDKRPQRLRELLNRTGLGLAGPGSRFPDPPHAQTASARVNHAERQARQWGREAEREARQWGRKAEREARQQAQGVRRHWDERKYRHHMRGRAFRNPLFVALILLGLGFARIGNWALFRVFLPTLLSILSIFFGSGLRRAAQRCADVGVVGERGLVFASDVIRSRFTGVEPPPPAEPKVRVDERGPIRVEEVPPEDEVEIDAEHEARRSQR
jgi:Protein kinase domain